MAWKYGKYGWQRQFQLKWMISRHFVTQNGHLK